MLTWLQRLFGRKTRAPRRARCACGHRRSRHFKNGCAQCVAVSAVNPCRLNRQGKPARMIAAVKGVA